MVRLSTLGVLLVALGASAQTTSLLTPFSIRSTVDATTDTVLFSAASCGESLTMQWALTGITGTPQGAMKLWATKSTECGDAPGTGDKTFDEIPVQVYVTYKSGTFSAKFSELPGFATTATLEDGGTTATSSCGDADKYVAMKICGSYTYLTNVYSGTSTTSRASPLKVIYDTQPPAAPTVGEGTAYDGTARLAFTVDSDTTTVFAEAREVTDGGEAPFVGRGEAAASATVVKLTGLVNGTTYQVRLLAQDAAGNVSAPSELFEVTPRKTVGFWGAYRQAGGTDEAGCTAVPAAWPLGALALTVLLRAAARRNRR